MIRTVLYGLAVLLAAVSSLALALLLGAARAGTRSDGDQP